MKRTILFLTFIGILIGAGAGYLYYHYVGCAGGTCAITSRPITSTLYVAMMGGLLLNAIQTLLEVVKEQMTPMKTIVKHS